MFTTRLRVVKTFDGGQFRRLLSPMLLGPNIAYYHMTTISSDLKSIVNYFCNEFQVQVY